MSRIANPLFRTLSLVAVYSAAAGAVVLAASPARAEDLGRAWPIHQAEAPIATFEQARVRVAHVLPQLPVQRVELDDERSVPHFHVDVRLGDGRIGRLNVDTRTGDLSWRRPAVTKD